MAAREFGGRLLRVQPGPPDAVDAAVDQLVQLRPGKTAVRHDPGHFGEEDRVARIVFVEAPDRGRPPDRNSVAELGRAAPEFPARAAAGGISRTCPKSLTCRRTQNRSLACRIRSAPPGIIGQRHTDPVDAGVKIHILPRAAEQRHRTVEETAADRFAGYWMRRAHPALSLSSLSLRSPSTVCGSSNFTCQRSPSRTTMPPPARNRKFIQKLGDWNRLNTCSAG